MQLYEKNSMPIQTIFKGFHVFIELFVSRIERKNVEKFSLGESPKLLFWIEELVLKSCVKQFLAQAQPHQITLFVCRILAHRPIHAV